MAAGKLIHNKYEAQPIILLALKSDWMSYSKISQSFERDSPHWLNNLYCIISRF